MDNKEKSNGFSVDLSDGREVSVYDFRGKEGGPDFGLYFISKEGIETRVGLSVEATRALRAILNKMGLGEPVIGFWFNVANCQWLAECELEGK